MARARSEERQLRALDAGWVFRYRERTYRVTGWCKAMAPPEPAGNERHPFGDILNELLYETQQKVGPDRCRLVFCDQDEAEYVCGTGVAGCIARVTDIEVIGPEAWPLALLDEAQQSAQRLVGTPIR